ncbi:hypothetical protein C8034_v004873 [Colletotrichum sidae]|uniref:Uncharacterized protein n=1 Tax=Colletotrichum sidae TaxID=1347389 RepID=A0A4V3I283_9PEZI|nr:hypothetical protein C8034_v004873 [Colletotrichum sidae]
MDLKQLNPADVQSLTTWPKHPDLYLDHPVSEYRSVLDSWVKGRQEGICIFVYTEAPEPIERPELDLPHKYTSARIWKATYSRWRKPWVLTVAKRSEGRATSPWSGNAHHTTKSYKASISGGKLNALITTTWDGTS